MTDISTTKPLSQQDIHAAFIRAVHSMAGAKDRWQQRIKTGLNDPALQEALQYELGLFGGFSARDMLSIAYQGAGLKIWASWDGVNHCTDTPILQGKQTIAYAREVFNIPNPDNNQMSLF